jgi:hypothetical protein
MRGTKKQIDVKEQKIVKDYGKIHGQINSIAITSDNNIFGLVVRKTMVMSSSFR